MSRNERNLTDFQYGIAGAWSGIFTRCTCQPFDVLKVRFQVQIASKQQSQVKYTSMYQAVTRIVKEEGIKSLWKGHIPGQWLSAIYGAAQFATYERFTKNWRKNSLAHFCGGAVSGVVAVTASYPFDLLRTRLIAQGEPKFYFSMLDANKKILAAEGWKGLYKGLVPACVQNAPLSALIFGINHIFTSFLVKIKGVTNLPVSNTFGCAAIAGFGSKLIVYPFDLVKKRLQVQGMPDGAVASGPIVRTRGVLNCFLTTFRNEGLRGFYKGLAPSLLKATVSNAFYLTSYDLACRIIDISSVS